jgi:hypothetical protein
MIQAGRFARHPLFLLGLAFLGLNMLAMYDDSPTSPSAASEHVFVSFFVGVIGLIVAARLTRTEDRALALLPSAPVPATTRTLALVGACFVPASVGLLWFAWRLLTWVSMPPPGELVAAFGGWGPILAFNIGGSVVTCFGGAVLGVAVGRWLRFPGAEVLFALVLCVVVVFMVGGGLAQRSANEWHIVYLTATAMPWTDWVLIDRTDDLTLDLVGVRDGSPYGHLLYAVGLTGLAIWAAVMKDAEGPERVTWRRRGAALGVATVLGLAWAIVG